MLTSYYVVVVTTHPISPTSFLPSIWSKPKGSILLSVLPGGAVVVLCSLENLRRSVPCTYARKGDAEEVGALLKISTVGKPTCCIGAAPLGTKSRVREEKFCGINAEFKEKSRLVSSCGGMTDKPADKSGETKGLLITLVDGEVLIPSGEISQSVEGPSGRLTKWTRSKSSCAVTEHENVLWPLDDVDGGYIGIGNWGGMLWYCATGSCVCSCETAGSTPDVVGSGVSVDPKHFR